MNNDLVSFLNGNLAVKVSTAKDMKDFVNWLEKYDIHEILVANRQYYDQYFKISFWKDFAKQCLKQKQKWIHPRSLCIYFGYIPSGLYWNYDREQVSLDFNEIVEAKDL